MLSVLFALVVLLGALLKFWLASRQMRAVAMHRGAVPPAFAGRITLPAHQRAADYTLAKLRFGLLELAYSTMVLLGWTLLGGLDALNAALLAVWGTHALAQPLALLIAFTVINGVIDLPFSLFQTFVIEQRFGFNKMTGRLWLMDLLKSMLVGAVIGIPLALAALWLMQAAGPWWWLWVWALWLGFSLLMMVLTPLVIAPLFNKFEPLQDDVLATRVMALMARCGFAAKGLFVMDGSRRSTHSNAYFTGFGVARRVVFFDTLLKQLELPEVEATLAHELGHLKRRHLAQRLALIAVLSLAGLALLAWLAGQSWFYTGLGVTPNLPPALGGAAPNSALALILFMLATPAFGFFVLPLAAWLSRRHEFQADAYAAGQANAADLARALVKLYQDNASTLTPDPVYVYFYYSHPPALARIARLGLQSSANAA
jgi:STE24 endopeptidase